MVSQGTPRKWEVLPLLRIPKFWAARHALMHRQDCGVFPQEEIRHKFLSPRLGCKLDMCPEVLPPLRLQGLQSLLLGVCTPVGGLHWVHSGGPRKGGRNTEPECRMWGACLGNGGRVHRKEQGLLGQWAWGI